MSFPAPESVGSVQLMELATQPTAVIRIDSVAMANIASVFDEGFGSLTEALSRGDFRPAGPAICRYLRMDDTCQECDVELGFPVEQPLTEGVDTAQHPIVGSTLPAGTYARLSHLGAYDTLAAGWQEMMRQLGEAGYAVSSPAVEVYVTKSTPQTDPAELRTDLLCPVQVVDRG